MNERIKALQVLATVKENTPGAYGDHEWRSKLDAEKFADLIIRECINQCDLIGMSYTVLRKNTDDFVEKNRLAEGDLAATHIKNAIAATFWNTPE
jgi:hypothetical protein